MLQAHRLARYIHTEHGIYARRYKGAAGVVAMYKAHMALPWAEEGMVTNTASIYKGMLGWHEREEHRLLVVCSQKFKEKVSK